MTASLKERKMLGVLDCGRLCESANGLGQKVSVVGHRDARGDFRLGERLRHGALGVNDRILVRDLLPLEDFLLPVASKLSRYCLAVSKRLRVTSATTSLP